MKLFVKVANGFLQLNVIVRAKMLKISLAPPYQLAVSKVAMPKNNFLLLGTNFGKMP